MSDVTLRTAVVSADTSFRTAVAEMLQAHGEMATVVADLPMAAGVMNAEHIERLQGENPEVVLVDLNGDPSGGLRMVRLISDAAPGRTLIGTGPALAPELLLEAMKAGITEYLPAPVDAHELAEALRRAGRRLGRGAPAKHASAAGRVYTFTGAKGGTGVTTLTANAALQIARQQNRTLLLDLSLEGGNLAVAMGMKPRYSLVDLLENFHRVDESLLSSLMLHHEETGLELLAAPLLPEAVPNITADQMRAALRLLRRHYDTIIIDLGRPYTPYGRAVVDNSDIVYLVIVPDVLAVHGAKRLLPLIRKGVEARDGRVEVVLNRTTGDDEIQKSDVEDALGVPVHHALRRDDSAVLSSLNLGKPLTLNGSRSKYVKDVRVLCAGIAGAPAEAESRAVARLLGRFGRAPKK